MGRDLAWRRPEWPEWTAVVVVACLWPRLAGAQPASNDAQPGASYSPLEWQDPDDGLDNLPFEGPKRIGLRVFAAASTGVDSDDAEPGAQAAVLSAGGELSIDNDLCSAVLLGGAGHLWATQDGRRMRGEQWGSFCLVRGVSNWTLGYQIEYDVRPPLQAAVVRPPGLNRGFTFNADIELLSLPFDARALRLDPGPPVHLRVFTVDAAMSFLSVDDTFDVLSDIDFATVRVHRDRSGHLALRPFVLDALAVEHQGTNDVFVLNMYAVRMKNAQLGQFLFDVEVGGGFGSAGELVSEYEHEVESGGTFLARLGVARASRNHSVQLSASRGLGAAFGGHLVLDHRIDSAIELRSASVALRVRPFVGYTRLMSPPSSMPPVGYQWTGGAGLDLEWRIKSWLSATAAGDVARSFYAGDTANFGTPQLGVQAIAGVAAHWGTR